jgi:plastocyanin
MKRSCFVSTALITGLFATVPLEAADHKIDQKDRSFSQTEVTVKPGDTVTFHNSDDVTHNVFSMTTGMEFEIRRQTPGASSTVPFPKEGTSEVRCSIHPKMKLIVHVAK